MDTGAGVINLNVFHCLYLNSGNYCTQKSLYRLALPKNYTWQVPESFLSGLVPGCRVEVSLKNKKYAGILKRLISEKPEAFNPRPIESVLDAEPLIYREQLALWEWISQYYMCSEGEVMAASLPAHFKLSSESTLVFNEVYSEMIFLPLIMMNTWSLKPCC